MPNCLHTCLQKCDSVNQAAEMGNCFCDKACETHGDCCLDYFVHCFNTSAQLLPNEGSGDGEKANSGPTYESSFQETLESNLQSAALMNPAWFQNTNDECISVKAGARHG